MTCSYERNSAFISIMRWQWFVDSLSCLVSVNKELCLFCEVSFAKELWQFLFYHVIHSCKKSPAFPDLFLQKVSFLFKKKHCRSDSLPILRHSDLSLFHAHTHTHPHTPKHAHTRIRTPTHTRTQKHIPASRFSCSSASILATVCLFCASANAFAAASPAALSTSERFISPHMN